MLRIELESKKLELETVQTDHLEQIESLEERALNAERMAKVWELKCADVPRASSSNYKSELREISQRQKLLEATNRQLAVEAQALTEGSGLLKLYHDLLK